MHVLAILTTVCDTEALPARCGRETSDSRLVISSGVCSPVMAVLIPWSLRLCDNCMIPISAEHVVLDSTYLQYEWYIHIGLRALARLVWKNVV
jgi:hypothetical protein